jgi:uncharacterized protein (TIGR03435 family)
MKMGRLLGTGVVCVAQALAQAPAAATAPSFDVASVKPAPPSPDGRIRSFLGGDAGRVNWTNASLRDIIREAYRLKDYQISGPDWLGTERYNLVAKLPDGAPESQKGPMLQTLLAERFHLTVHREKRYLPAYSLTVAKGGVKMKEFVEGSEGAAEPVKSGPEAAAQMRGAGKGAAVRTSFGRIQVEGVTSAGLAEILSAHMDRPVVDETSLTATYDVALNWTPETGDGTIVSMKIAMARQRGEEVKVPEASGPTLPVAIQQQLGLKMDAKKLPIEVLVVDHAEKVPTEN